jgi:hypothetical protein
VADVFRIKRRDSAGAAGAPSSLAASEIAYNEKDDRLYYGKGNSGGLATSIIPIAGPGYVFVRISDSAPTGPVAGQLWWNSSTGTLAVYYTDANTSQWVQVGRL